MDKFSYLTDREKHILKELGEGQRDRDIANFLGVHPRSISRNITVICEKIHAKTRTQAAVMYYLNTNGIEQP